MTYAMSLALRLIFKLFSLSLLALPVVLPALPLSLLFLLALPLSLLFLLALPLFLVFILLQNIQVVLVVRLHL